ncbi:MAG TPA: glutamate--tRNA ligase [Candidatus Wildermuthbacteria bacterium]|uniref:Glutamate--tRNA ligase n=1 Tax=Candidatus Yanofskybacteria bacterium GW2011_GWC1_48_11 TaxID=1619027 RepID=A0A837IMU5_9BACT|nr:MAG: Glutamate-tRNA ligase [Candidatus Yanofskybacteria bacterium GW2011_GWC1_48_11]KKW04694.1 MAG: Glutamate-tRNA ligase [Parcubacteria group bacterium GW2011_GWB1_49_12]KKW09006.1 MAG: Glutamate-tRNA ligase [Parcubacteria group bacterium GW2011_GWA1_49_26]KKW14224.1 MAG: Glutamate-tRNA ligase [Parcubacteria group bacterium GW2011_GWA2_50_10]OHA61059.1 MAG: glutamate--tRNA ligase [Candidatus Wildermuthbacteria bacterium GWA1_49_26]OHA66020.1 MAG: glutamate--tRNA ligase [Candidatus Wildermu
MDGKVRTRIAPSPTGWAHMGTARTALFNYLFAKKEGGDFILRIEDTDKERSQKEYEQDVLESFRWLGLEWDEGPEKNGKYGPYRQSERTELYKKYLTKLLEQGRAYWCFCTPEELEAQRAHQMSLGEAPRYKGACRNLSPQEQQGRLASGTRGVIRFAVEPKTVAFHDLIRGEIAFDTGLLGDVVIAKDLETPLYNFSVVVDDFEMQITHVIRGEDHITNTPRQILIQEALELPGVQYAHLPLLLGEDRSKLSKRHGDNSVRAFRQQGYLPEAVVNFLALLGWNPGSDREIFSLPELVKEFSLERIQKGGAIFNLKRLDWINGLYIRHMRLEELAALCAPYLPRDDVDSEKQKAIVGLYQERLKKLAEIAELADFFFADTLQYDAELLLWKDATKEGTQEILEKIRELLNGVGESEWTKDNLEKILMPEAEKAGPPEKPNRGYMLWPMRAALSGKKASPGPFEIAEVLGKEKTLERIQNAIKILAYA